MILFAESTTPSNITAKVQNRTIFSVSPDYTKPNVIIKDETIVYSAALPIVGIIIQDQPQLFYGISSL